MKLLDALMADRNTGIYVDGDLWTRDIRVCCYPNDAQARVIVPLIKIHKLWQPAELAQQDPRFQIIHASFCRYAKR